MKRVALALAVAIAFAGAMRADDDHNGKRDHDPIKFRHGTLLLSRSVYVGTPSMITPGTATTPGVTLLPPGCVAGTITLPILNSNPPATTSAKIKGCGVPAIADGTYPTVFNNDQADSSFGITSPIFLDNITKNGRLLFTISIPSDQVVTSFSSKSELALNLSQDTRSITFVGYRGNSTNPTMPNLFDVSNSNTPGVVDPTNPVVSSYYRTVVELDAHGRLRFTEGNAYSGNNGRAAIKANHTYYLTGNDNNGALSSSQLTTTQVGVNLINSTGFELLYPGQTPPLPPNINKIGDFEISQLIDPVTGKPYANDKAGKDNNFRGLSIWDNTLYVTKGSGGNGVNTVYMIGTKGELPDAENAPGNPQSLLNFPITILPGLPTGLATGFDSTGKTPTPVSFPFGIWFANANTLYVADEGDGCTSLSQPQCPDIKVVSATAPIVTPTDVANSIYSHAANQKGAGLQKWIFDSTASKWKLAYTIQTGLNLGVQYIIPGYPTGNNTATGLPWAPVTDGLRNITGQETSPGIVTIWAITSTVSGSGDQGADPNHLVRVSDPVDATSPATSGLDSDDNPLDQFVIVRSAKSGEVLRGIALAPGE